MGSCEPKSRRGIADTLVRASEKSDVRIKCIMRIKYPIQGFWICAVSINTRELMCKKGQPSVSETKNQGGLMRILHLITGGVSGGM